MLLNTQAETEGHKMQRTIFSIILGFILTFTFTGSNLAQAQGNPIRPAMNARSFVVARGVGNKVKVTLLDGTRTTGTISRIGDASFELVREPGGPILSVEYNNVAKIKKAGWSSVSMIALGAGIGVVAVVAIVAVAVATVDLDPFPNGFRKKR